jgi:hypothetical protein
MKVLKGITLLTCLLIVIVNLQSCLTLLSIGYSAKPKIEHDEVKGITRFKSTLFYNWAEESYSSFIKSEQQIFKETNGINSDYTIYEYLNLENRLNQIENTIYFIIDKQVYPIEINYQSNKSLSEVEKDEEDIMLADSSKMTVIEDYEIRHYTSISINYTVDESLLYKIANAKEVKIRYYAPPEMITLKLSKHKTKTFGDLANSEFEYNQESRSKAFDE